MDSTNSDAVDQQVAGINTIATVDTIATVGTINSVDTIVTANTVDIVDTVGTINELATSLEVSSNNKIPEFKTNCLAFRNIKAAYSVLEEHGQLSGYPIIKKRSVNRVTKEGEKYCNETIVCSGHGRTKPRLTSRSIKCDCKFEVRLSKSAGSDRCTMRIVNGSHNHGRRNGGDLNYLRKHRKGLTQYFSRKSKKVVDQKPNEQIPNSKIDKLIEDVKGVDATTVSTGQDVNCMKAQLKELVLEVKYISTLIIRSMTDESLDGKVVESDVVEDEATLEDAILAALKRRTSSSSSETKKARTIQNLEEFEMNA